MWVTIGNWLYVFFGISGSGPHYAFWSGPGSDIGEITIVGVVIGWLRHKNCHVKGCWRLGKLQVPGTQHVVCRKHHPHDAPTAQQVLDDYRDAVNAMHTAI
jgi:hypothetical protein